MSAMQPSIRNSLLLLSRTPQSISYQRLLPSTTTASQLCQTRRPFSQSPGHRAVMGSQQTVKPKVPAQQGTRSRMKSVPVTDVPTDMGLLPGTFIRPTSENMPSIFQEPKDRLRMEWIHLKTKVMDLIGLVAYTKYINKRVPLRIRERKQAALDLHRKMYTAFAEGDQPTIRSVCCDGLRQDFSVRMSSRSTRVLNWTLHKYYRSLPTFTTAKILSDRATALPGAAGGGLRQVVVRIKSRQSIGKPAADGSGSESAPDKQKDCVENVVIQMMMWQGKEQGWKVWGMADETTVEDLEGPLFQSGLSLTDRLTMLKAQYESKK